jgi:hypothetical protein
MHGPSECLRYSLRLFINRGLKLFGIAVLAVAPWQTAISQASLASEDIINSLKVGDESFTVVRDAVQRDQWYFIPDRPRLFEKKTGNVTTPEFALLKYQFKDPANAANLLEGGVLQFSASLDLQSNPRK